MEFNTKETVDPDSIGMSNPISLIIFTILITFPEIFIPVVVRDCVPVCLQMKNL